MSKYIKVIFLFITLIFGLNVKAQQDPRFNTYLYNLSVINPAAAGTGNGLEIYGGLREQWAGIEGNPQTQTFNINKGFGEKVGLGFNVFNDDVFIVSDVGLFADFSYKLQLNSSTNLYLGLKAGGSFLNIDFDQLEVQNDNLLRGKFSKFNPNVGIGAYIKKEKYSISLSAPRLLSNDRFDENTESLADDRAHIFLGMQYIFALSNSWDLKPQTMLTAVSGSPLSVDLILLAQYSDKFEFGANYRYDESVTAIATFVFSDFGKIGFAYGYSTNDIQDLNNGTIEIFAKFTIKDKSQKIIE